MRLEAVPCIASLAYTEMERLHVAIVFNIRGTNGAGKTTLARAFLPPNLNGDSEGGPLDLNWYESPTKKNPNRRLRVEGYGHHQSPTEHPIVVIGRYTQACGGLDTISAGFAVQQGAIRYACDVWTNAYIIAEGVLASTVFGSWATLDRDLEEAGHRFAWCYLDTPLEVCFEHIRKRQEAAGNVGKVIKADLVRDKHKAILSTRSRAIGEGRRVYDLPWQFAADALTLIMMGQGEGYRARSHEHSR